MARKKYLRKKQLDVLRDMFSSELDEQQVLDKHNVGAGVYSRWLADELFWAEFSRLVEAARLRSQALLARYSFVAAAKLIELTGSEKGETARKACLDIIALPKAANEKVRPSDVQQGVSEYQQLSPETAGRLLAALAKEKGKTMKRQKSK